jgi:hypothetical protein
VPGEHLDILADKAIICRKIRELYRILTTFDTGKEMGAGPGSL